MAERGYFGQSSNGTGTSVSPYLGAGIGAYFSHASGGGTSKTNTQVGGKIFLGAELNSGPFIEAAYEILPRAPTSTAAVTGSTALTCPRISLLSPRPNKTKDGRYHTTQPRGPRASRCGESRRRLATWTQPPFLLLKAPKNAARLCGFTITTRRWRGG